MKLVKIVLSLSLFYSFLSTNSQTQVFLTEGFEVGSRPDGWTEETVSGNEPWRFRNGGHSPNDNNWQVPPEQEDITRNPPSAYAGTYNAIFFKQGDNNERTKLITPEMDLLGATAVELSFYLCQIPWTFEGSTGWDVLRVYYRVSAEDPWILLHEYLDPVYEWEEQKLTLPAPSETYYVAFEGHTRWGYGTCIDDVTIEETGSQSLYVGEIDFEQPFENYIPSGSPDVPIMRIDLKVFGNQDSAILERVHFTSMNTDDGDIQSTGVKLYASVLQTFSTDNQLGSSTDFSSGVASFTGLAHSLPAGVSYLWLTYDVAMGAGHGNILDAMVASGGIQVNGITYPSTDQSPVGEKYVYETRYREDFEGVHNWTLTGEFEVDSPSGLGGTPGNPDPPEAFNGVQVLGTDLTGLGTYPYNYEPGVSEESSYLATSPSIDAQFYKNLHIFFRRHLNLEVWDKASIEVSPDDGVSWSTIWESNSFINDFQWTLEKQIVPDLYARTGQFRFRYRMGPTSGSNNYSGWNIDDIYLTGEFIYKDVGVSEWISPESGSGHTDSDSVTVRVRNFGGADITDPIPVAYSFDGGENWTINYMNQDIPVGGDVAYTFTTRADLTAPGLRPSVLAKTAVPGDQYTGNDLLTTELFVIPTYVPPYSEDFEEYEGFWQSEGNGLWNHGLPAGEVIDGAASGVSSWGTALSGRYGDVISDQSEAIFFDDFETEKGWNFSGEFERDVPSNMYAPYFPYSGFYCAGTDLTGLGTSPYLYENGITEGTAYSAVSPAMDVSAYSNIKVSFASWIEIQAGDSVRLEVSPDNGSTWMTLWKNTEGSIMDAEFSLNEYPVPESLNYSTNMRFRLSLFHSSAGGAVAAGWNFDDFKVEGDLVDTSPAYLRSVSYDLRGMANPVFEAQLWVDTEPDVDGATLFYSLDNGKNWTHVGNSSGYDSYWNWYTGNVVQALGRNGWSGQSEGWITVRHLLPAAVTGQEDVQFRIEFSADKENNQYDGLAVDDVRIFEAPQDIDLLEIIDPVTACALGSENFTLRLRNSGISAMQIGDSVSVGYHINRTGEIQSALETLVLTQSIPVGATRDISFSTDFDFSTSGDYNVQIYAVTEDPHFYESISGDTVAQIISVNSPMVELGDDISTVRPDTVVLRAYSGVPGQTYLWQDSSTDSLFQVNTEGTYHVKVTNGIGCSAFDTIQVLQLVLDAGLEQIVAPLSDCELTGQRSLDLIIRNFGTDTVTAGNTITVHGSVNQADTFSDPVLLSQDFRPGETLEFSSSRFYDFSTPGSYQIQVYTELVNDMDASNDTLDNTLEVFGYPDVNLGPDTTVLSSEYLLQPTPGYFSYLWQDESTAETFTVNTPGMSLYHVTVNDENQCTGYDSVYVNLQVLDLELDQLLSPSTSCELSESITVSARIRNAGNQAIPSGETIDMGYSINGGAVEQDAMVLTEDLLSGAYIDFVFSKTESVTTGQWYDFVVFVDYMNDAKTFNDTVMTTVGVFETPSLDLGDDFQVITEVQYILDAGPGFATYLWQDESTDQTFLIDQPGIGAYSVTVTDINGCSVSDSVTILLAIPDVGVKEVVQPATACTLEGEQRVQVAIQNFGNYDIEPPASITVSYSINGSPAITEDVILEGTFGNSEVIYHTFTPFEDFSNPGRYEIVAYTEYAADRIPANDIILISVDHFGSPFIDIGNGADTLVLFEPITLSATPGYASYEWQDGSTDPDYIISEPSAAMYRVAVTADNGCVTHDSVYVAYDRPDLSIVGIVSPISGCHSDPAAIVSVEIQNNGFFRITNQDTVIVTYSVDGGSSVFMDLILENELGPGESMVASFENDPYDFSAPGSYRVQVSLIYPKDLDISNNILSTDVDIREAANVEIGGGQDTLLTSLPVTLDAGTGFSSYEWQDMSTGSTYEVTSAGWYFVTVSNSAGCTDTDSVYVDEHTSVGEQILLPGQVRIYPNPVEDLLNVDFNLDKQRHIILELYSITNSLMYRKDFKQIQITETIIDVQHLVPGSYYLRIITDMVPHNFMVIVE